MACLFSPLQNISPKHKWPLTCQGRGAWHRNNWFQLPWDCRSLSLGIAEKELIPIVPAGAAWGNTWRNQHILCQCDNQVVVACLHSRTSKTNGLMHLLRCLVFIEAFYGFQIDPLYINTHDNHLADDLSRNKLSSFLLKVPHADPQPTSLPKALLDLLLDPQADWTLPTWRRHFNAIFN